MTVIREGVDILRKTLELHMQAFLDGREPMYMAEVTSTINNGVNNILRRYYEPVYKSQLYSHVSYLGRREIILETTNLSSGNTFLNNVMLGNAPLTREHERRARTFYEDNPDITSEAIADLVISEYNL
jgi:hypothetical protein